MWIQTNVEKKIGSVNGSKNIYEHFVKNNKKIIKYYLQRILIKICKGLKTQLKVKNVYTTDKLYTPVFYSRGHFTNFLLYLYDKNIIINH